MQFHSNQEDGGQKPKKPIKHFGSFPGVEFVSLKELLSSMSQYEGATDKKSKIMDMLQGLRDEIFKELQKVEGVMTRLKHNPEAESLINDILSLSDEQWTISNSERQGLRIS